FSYIITDQDGDTATATQTIEIIADDIPTTGVDDGAGTEPDDQFIVYVAGLGSDPEPTEVTTVTGNVMANDNIGVDGATITQIEVDGDIFTDDDNDGVIIADTDIGRLTIDVE